MSVTDEDRATAQTAMGWGGLSEDYLTGAELTQRDAIAAALAAEREKARAPFLRVADELDENAQRADDAEPVKTDDLLRMITAARVSRDAAARIRQAAQDQP